MAHKMGMVLLTSLTSLLGVVAQAQPPGPTHSGSPSNCNRWHVIVSGDTCATVPVKYGISSTQFFTWNPAVSKDCLTNFWLGSAYCVGVGVISSTTRASTTTSSLRSVTRISTPPGPTFTNTPKNCNSWHRAEDGDTCASVASHYRISMMQFLDYNPSVSKDCTQNFWLNQAYCVGLGPAVSTTITKGSTSTSTKSTSSFKSTYSIKHPVSDGTITRPVIDDSWPPQKTQAGQPSYCTNWHLVGPGESCAGIILKYKEWMTLVDFYAWNPAIGTDCSGLYLYYYVCVDIQPQTTGAVMLPTFEANVPLPPYVSWSEPPLPIVDDFFTPTPSHGPMPTNCVDYEWAEMGYTCENILEAQPQISREQFFAWNPVLGGECDAVWANNYYCVGAYSDGNFPQPPTVKSKPSSLPANIISTCASWYQSTPGDTCDIIVVLFGSFSKASFLEWNPAAQSSCSNAEEMEPGAWYCVGIPGTPTTRMTPIVLPTSYPPYDDDDSSSSSVSKISASSSTTQRVITVTMPETSTTSGVVISTPQPIQGEMICGCRRFYFVQPNDGCQRICQDAGINISDFYKWNPAAAPDCSTMWASAYVCVGLTGPVVTFSGIPPKPT